MTEVMFPHQEIVHQGLIVEENGEEIGKTKPAHKASTMQTWQRFVDFLLRHLAQISMKYMDWEEDQYQVFCEALDFSEQIQGATLSLADLKERAKLLNVEKAKSDALNCDKYGNRIPDAIDLTPDPKAIFDYLDLVARLKEVAKVAGDLQKSLKKAKVDDISDQIEIQKYWKAMTLPRVDLSLMTLKDTESGPRAIWSALSRTIFNLGFQYLQKASVNSGIELDANAELVAFNLTDEEIEYAKLIVNAINLSIKSESKPDPNLDILSKLKGVGAVEESTFEIIGMNDDGGIILPPDVPKEKPKKKKKKGSSSKSGGKSAMSKGHHRKVKK